MVNINSTLAQDYRVREVVLFDLEDGNVNKISTMMQGSFPELTRLKLSSYNEKPPIILDVFLGGSLSGSAPNLLHFSLDGILFPRMSQFIFSATRLVELHLVNIPFGYHYHSPKTMISLLSTLSSLKVLYLRFKCPRSLLRAYRPPRDPPPPNRSTLPALEHFTFHGIPEYLEDFLNRVDTPQLDDLNVHFFILFGLDNQQLAQFINRTLEHRKHDDVDIHVQFGSRVTNVLIGVLRISVECMDPGWVISTITRVCSSYIPSAVEDLYMEPRYLDGKDDTIEVMSWLELLLPFTALKNLYLSKEFTPITATVLREFVGGKVTAVLPGLQNIFVEAFEPSGAFQEEIKQFVVERQLSSRPVAISNWDRLGQRL